MDTNIHDFNPESRKQRNATVKRIREELRSEVMELDELTTSFSKKIRSSVKRVQAENEARLVEKYAVSGSTSGLLNVGEVAFFTNTNPLAFSKKLIHFIQWIVSGEITSVEGSRLVSEIFDPLYLEPENAQLLHNAIEDLIFDCFEISSTTRQKRLEAINTEIKERAKKIGEANGSETRETESISSGRVTVCLDWIRAEVIPGKVRKTKKDWFDTKGGHHRPSYLYKCYLDLLKNEPTSEEIVSALDLIIDPEEKGKTIKLLQKSPYFKKYF